MIGDGETDVSELTSDRDNLRDLGLHGIGIAEGKSEEMFKKIMLMEVVVALIADLKKVPNFL